MPHGRLSKEVGDILFHGMKGVNNQNLEKALAVLDDRMNKIVRTIRETDNGDAVVAALKNMNPTFSGNVNLDTGQLEDILSRQLQSLDSVDDTTALILVQLNDIQDSIKALKDSISSIDVDIETPQIMAVLGEIRDEIKGDEEKAALLEKFSGIEQALSKIKVDVPDKVQLSDSQFRELKQTMKGGTTRVVGGGGQRPDFATKQTIANVSVDNSSESSYTFPGNTISFEMNITNQATKFHYAYESGKLPTSGDGSAYKTSPQNFIKSMDGVDWSNTTIYFELESSGSVSSDTMQIESHQL